jgi:hypothetical protein
MQPELRLTYAQIGARLQISADAARMLARRRGWVRQAPNRRGAPVFVIVPEDALEGEQWRTEEESTAQNTTVNGADARLNEAEARAELAEQRAEQAEQRANEAHKRADVAIVLVDRTLAELAGASARADQLLAQAAEATTRADRLREERDNAEVRAQAAQAEADQLRKAEAERREQGRWARLRAAWRGALLLVALPLAAHAQPLPDWSIDRLCQDNQECIFRNVSARNFLRDKTWRQAGAQRRAECAAMCTQPLGRPAGFLGRQESAAQLFGCCQL